MASRSSIHVGDCLAWLRTIQDASVDSIVTDPPYGLGKEPDPRAVLHAWLDGAEYQPGGRGFMGAEWDAFVPSPVVWAECYRVLKPGGHLLSFAGTRTYDWIALGVRLAGFEIRDQLAWLYGTGFPKSHNLKGDYEGWGTALKPAQEPIVMARKPFSGATYRNVLEHGTGAIHVDACRVGTEQRHNASASSNEIFGQFQGATTGRWPANVIHDGSAEVVDMFPSPHGAGYRTDGAHCALKGVGDAVAYSLSKKGKPCPRYGDTGSAARFFYSAKASKSEREWGLDVLGDWTGTTDDGRAVAADNAYQRGKSQRRNIHPTVKPVALIGYLQRLITPPGGLTLDPYLGSGTAAMAAHWEGFRFRGCEMDTAHATIAQLRYQYATRNPCPYKPATGGVVSEAWTQAALFGGES